MGPGAGGRGREAPPRTLWPPLPGASRRRDPAASEQLPAATTTGPGARGPGPPPASCARTAAPAGSGTRSPSPPPRRPRPRPSCAPAPAPPPLASWLCSLHPRAARSSPGARPLPPCLGPSASSPAPTHNRHGGHSAEGTAALTSSGPGCHFSLPALVWVGWGGVRSQGSTRTVPCA